ncbi:MAG: PadR family transcriptional regulator [bacterium]|nr:PadR family transcriptional regulator [bacterium]
MDMLTKLEELILLSVWRLKEKAYGTTIFNLIQGTTNKKLSLGGVYFPLDRLVKKGYLNAYRGDATEERRGLSKRYYSLTDQGRKALNELKQVNETMWAGYSDLETAGKNE